MRKNTIIKTFAAVILIGVLIFFNNSWPVKNLRGVSVAILKPFMSVSLTVSNFFGMNSAKLSSEEEAKLVQENQQLKALSFEMQKLRADNDALQKALRFKGAAGLPLRGARVLLYSREAGKELLLIDQGSESGINKDDLVVDSSGLFVGTVSEAADGFSQVEIASSAGKSFEVEFASSTVRALANGLGARAFAVNLVPAGTLINPGDFITLVSEHGLNGTVKPGHAFLLGEVVSENPTPGSAFKEARALLLVRPELLKEVFVVSSQ